MLDIPTESHDISMDYIFTNDKYKTIAIRAPSNFKFETYKALQLTYNSKSKIIPVKDSIFPSENCELLPSNIIK